MAAMKMSILPQILYIFRSLSIPIPNYYIASLSSSLRVFLWRGKRARCSHCNLIKHRSIRGAGVPNLQDYYRAAHLDQIRHWFTSEETLLWVKIEEALSPSQDLHSLLLSDMWKQLNLKTLTIPMQASLITWWHLTSLKSPQAVPHPTSPKMQIFEALIPQLSTKTLSPYGIYHATDLLKGNVPYNLEELKSKYKIPLKIQFTCIRIVHFLNTNPIPTFKLHSKAWEFYLSHKRRVKGISLFYNILQDKLNFSKSNCMLNWENDLCETYSPSQSQATFWSISQAFHCTSHVELILKITNRWHYTPRGWQNSPPPFPYSVGATVAG